MNSSVYKISLDIHKAESQAVLNMKKYDTDSRRIQISLTENGKPYRLTSDCSAVFSAKKPDNTAIYNDCSVLYEDNIITYDVTAQTTATVGILDCEIRLRNNEGKFLTSPRFVINVTDRVCDDDDIISTDEVNALQMLLNEAANIIEELKKGESTHTHENKSVLDYFGINYAETRPTFKSNDGISNTLATVDDVSSSIYTVISRIPTKTSELLNDSGFITKNDLPEIGGGSSGLPEVSEADNGKFLMVENGAWAAVAVPSAEEAVF